MNAPQTLQQARIDFIAQMQASIAKHKAAIGGNDTWHWVIFTGAPDQAVFINMEAVKAGQMTNPSLAMATRFGNEQSARDLGIRLMNGRGERGQAIMVDDAHRLCIANLERIVKTMQEMVDL